MYLPNLVCGGVSPPLPAPSHPALCLSLAALIELRGAPNDAGNGAGGGSGQGRPRVPPPSLCLTLCGQSHPRVGFFFKKAKLKAAGSPQGAGGCPQGWVPAGTPRGREISIAADPSDEKGCRSLAQAGIGVPRTELRVSPPTLEDTKELLERRDAERRSGGTDTAPLCRLTAVSGAVTGVPRGKTLRRRGGPLRRRGGPLCRRCPGRCQHEARGETSPLPPRFTPLGARQG